MRQAISLLQTDANSISASASGTIVRDGMWPTPDKTVCQRLTQVFF